MRTRSFWSVVIAIVLGVVIMVLTSYWSEFFSRKKLEYKIAIVRIPLEAYGLDLHLTEIRFRNSGRAKLANVPIKCYSENPNFRLAGTPMETVKNKSDVRSESTDMSAVLELIGGMDEYLASMWNRFGSELFSRLDSSVLFSIDALDPKRYSVHIVLFCSVPSQEIFRKDSINLISPDPRVYLSRTEQFSKPTSIWFVLFAISVLINALLLFYLVIRKRG